MKVSFNAGTGYQARASQAQNFESNRAESRKLAGKIKARLLRDGNSTLTLQRVEDAILGETERALSDNEKAAINAVVHRNPHKTVRQIISEAAQIASGQATAHLLPGRASSRFVSTQEIAPAW